MIPVLRELGIAALTRYGVYRLAIRSGLLRRRTKPYRWSDRPLGSWLRSGSSLEHALSHREPFFFETGNRLQEALQRFPSEDLQQEADEILAGGFRLFGGPPVPLGNPPDWGKIPLNPNSVRLDKHWTEYKSDTGKDLRLLWEPARFGWAFTLCRAHLFTGEQRYAEGLFEFLSSWLESNQPNCGPHWISGQETALRILALIFIWYALGETLESSPTRARDILIALAAHAERIPPTISYARAQRNNHLLTEAVGLYSVGLLMPWFKRSAEWKRIGRRWLIHALQDQVFEDGGYIQYSTNYQRLALSVGLWAARLADTHGEPLPKTSLDALQKMTEFLLSLTDSQNGTVPNWGHNDGSNILPLSTTEHGDYRPVLQAAAQASTGKFAFGSGPWDEMSVWLGLPVNGTAGMRRNERTDFPHAGLYLMRGSTSWSTLRCAHFTARPAHSDQLHLDIWWNEHNIALDSGTYRYSAPLPWENPFAGAEAHNSLVADGKEPMDQAGRFLWLNWSNARFLGRWQAEDGSIQTLAAEHPLRDGVTHRRSVVHAGGSLWVVLDELLGQGAKSTLARPATPDRHRARLAWSLIDWPWEFDAQSLTLRGDQGPIRLRLTPRMDQMALYRAGERVAGERQPAEDAAVLGWWSPTYGYKEPALTLVATVEGSLPLRMTSWWRLGEVEPQDLMLNLENLAEDPLLAFLSSG